MTEYKKCSCYYRSAPGGDDNALKKNLEEKQREVTELQADLNNQKQKNNVSRVGVC